MSKPSLETLPLHRAPSSHAATISQLFFSHGTWVGLVFWLFLLCLALAYLPGTYGPFLFDDEPNLQNLKHFAGKWTWSSLGHYLSMFGGALGRPLSALSFLVNDDAWPSDPEAFKTFNLFWHLLNGCLVFGLARTLAKAAGLAENVKVEVLALLAATMWLANPIHVSAVFLTVQRMTLLSATFVIAGLWSYAALVRRAPNFWIALLAIAVLGGFTILAVLSKENGILLPVIAWVLNATLLHRCIDQAPTGARRLLQIGTTGTTLAVLVVGTVLWIRYVNFSFREFSAIERLMTETRILVDYLTLFFVPRLSSSGLYNDDYTISTGLLAPPATLFASLALLGLLVFALRRRREHPLAAFGILWFLAGHTLESTVLPLELYFEHRNYLPTVGPAFAAAALVTRHGAFAHGLLRYAAIVWILLCLGLSHLQARVWGDQALLSRVWFEENPRSLRAHLQYADYLFRTGDFKKSRQIFELGDRRGVSRVDFHLQMMNLDCVIGDTVSDELLLRTKELLRTGHLAMGTPITLARLRIDAEKGRCAGTLSSKDWLDMTDIALSNPSAGQIQKFLRVERFYHFLWQKNLQGSMTELEAAYLVDKDPQVALHAAGILASAGLYTDALFWVDRAERGDPNAFKRWMRNDAAEARELRKTILADQARSGRQK